MTSHHLHPITSIPSPRPHHLVPTTSSPSPRPHHLVPITLSPSPRPHHLVPITSSPSPRPHHLVPITSSPSPPSPSLSSHLECKDHLPCNQLLSSRQKDRISLLLAQVISLHTTIQGLERREQVEVFSHVRILM